MTSDLVGINSNYGDTATISGSCGVTKDVCEDYQGIEKGGPKEDGPDQDSNKNCGGPQGTLATLPRC